MNIGIYKPGQGYWVRTMTAAFVGILALFGAVWAWGQVEAIQLPAKAFQYTISYADEPFDIGTEVDLHAPSLRAEGGTVLIARGNIVGFDRRTPTTATISVAIDPNFDPAFAAGDRGRAGPAGSLEGPAGSLDRGAGGPAASSDRTADDPSENLTEEERELAEELAEEPVDGEAPPNNSPVTPPEPLGRDGDEIVRTPAEVSDVYIAGLDRGLDVRAISQVPIIPRQYLQAGAAAVIILVAAVLLYYFVASHRKSVNFLIETDGEMKKVNWSSKREVIGSTQVVIVAAFLIAALLFGIDYVFSNFFRMVGVLEI